MANGVELDFHRKMCAPSTKEKVRRSGLAICPIICAARARAFSLSYRRCTQLVGAATGACLVQRRKLQFFNITRLHFLGDCEKKAVD
jgi:hypothetical protein